MKPPIKNLIGGVEESHTREYLFKISAQMMGCRERSKNRLQEQQEHKNKCRTRVFGEKERGRKKTYLEGGPVGPRRPMGAARGWAAPAGRLGHWWVPLAGPRSLWVTPDVEIFILIFLEFFWKLHCWKFFEVQKAAKLSENLKQLVVLWSFKNINTWYSK